MRSIPDQQRLTATTISNCSYLFFIAFTRPFCCSRCYSKHV